jgi:hypothetical protein
MSETKTPRKEPDKIWIANFSFVKYFYAKEIPPREDGIACIIFKEDENLQLKKTPYILESEHTKIVAGLKAKIENLKKEKARLERQYQKVCDKYII